jgi:hypothetical protein
MHPLIKLKKATPIFLVVLGCFAVSSIAQAVNPPPDGGYPNNNTAEGIDALFSLTTGNANTAIGSGALFSNATGDDNTATGSGALIDNTTGDSNTATGVGALFSNTTGSDNTATGAFALKLNTIGDSNTATGFEALQLNTTGSVNTGNGFAALFSNTTGSNNTAIGYEALTNNTTGNFNTASGVVALEFNTTGGDNTASGFAALFDNTTGGSNTANGFQALFHNTVGSNNIALGFSAGSHLTTGNNNIDIGNVGVAAESATIRIGTQGTQTKAFIAGIHGVPVTGAAVFVSSSGQLGVAPSSEGFKDQIEPMDKASEAILALKPVTFRYKKEIDPERSPQFGLVAEDVEKVNPDLVMRDGDGKVYTVRYEAVNAMLLNEFLKEHKAFLEEHRTVEELKKEVAALTAGLQKVSAQVEVSRAALQTVLNNP